MHNIEERFTHEQISKLNKTRRTLNSFKCGFLQFLAMSPFKTSKNSQKAESLKASISLGQIYFFRRKCSKILFCVHK